MSRGEFVQVKTGVWHQEMCSSSVHPEIRKTIGTVSSYCSGLLRGGCQEEFTKASVMRSACGNHSIEIYLRLHIYTGMLYIVRDNDTLANCPSVIK